MQFKVLKNYFCKLEPPNSIPWELIAPHEKYAMEYHGGQSLKRLHERGGLAPEEIWHVINHKSWWPKNADNRISAEDAVKWLENLTNTNKQSKLTS